MRIQFFYSTTIIRNNKNTILVLKDNNGQEKFNHEDKASLLRDAFKERLVTFKFTHMHFDLNHFIHPIADLEDLTLPFTEEINSIVASLPNGKSLGPDGFNTKFMKRCWPIIS
jgi:hypothetical protein